MLTRVKLKTDECCIYLIINKITNKFYLGSTIEFNRRKNVHLNKLRKNKHHSQYLQNSVNKYGIDNFEVVIYQFCNKNERLGLEDYYIKTLNPAYNVSKSALSPMEGRKHSKSTREKMSNRSVPRGTESWNYGRKHSEETRLKMSKLRIGGKQSDETKIKMRETAKKINSISRIDRTKTYRKIKDQYGNIFNSLSEASKYYNISVQAICDNLKGRSIKTVTGIVFKYADDNTDFVDIKELIKNRKLELLDPAKIELIKSIKNDITEGLRPKEIIKKYNITKSFHDKIKSRKSYKYV